MRRLNLVIALLALTWAQTAAARKDVGWGGGEKIYFDVYLSGIRAGRTVIGLGKQGRFRGQQALKIRAHSSVLPAIAHMIDLEQDLTSIVALEQVRPVRTRLSSKRGQRSRVITTDWRSTNALQTVTARGRKRLARRTVSGGHDLLSALLSLRSRKLDIGQRFELTVLSGTSLYRCAIRVVEADRLRVDGVRRAALKLEAKMTRISDQGRAVGRPFRLGLWLSNDAQRVPLKVQTRSKFGRIELRLSRHSPAQTAVSIGKLMR